MDSFSEPECNFPQEQSSGQFLQEGSLLLVDSRFAAIFRVESLNHLCKICVRLEIFLSLIMKEQLSIEAVS